MLFLFFSNNWLNNNTWYGLFCFSLSCSKLEVQASTLTATEATTVLLHPHDRNSFIEEESDTDDKLMLTDTKDESNHQSTEFPSFKDSTVLTTMQDSTRGKWKRAQVKYL